MKLTEKIKVIEERKAKLKSLGVFNANCIIGTRYLVYVYYCAEFGVLVFDFYRNGVVESKTEYAECKTLTRKNVLSVIHSMFADSYYISTGHELVV